MGAVKITGKTTGLMIRLKAENALQEIEDVRSRLRLLKTRDGHPAEVFFNSLPDEETLRQLFSMLQECGCTCMALHQSQADEPPADSGPFQIISESLRAGQVHHLNGQVLLLQDVRRGVQIEMNSGTLYVMGAFSGQLSMNRKDSRLIAMALCQGRIKISDSDWQVMTNSAKVCVYYESQRCRSQSLKEEEVWQGSL